MSGDSIEVIEMLLEDGTHHNIGDSKLPCPIFTAIGCENLNIIDILISHEADLEIRNEDGNPTFTRALWLEGNLVVIGNLVLTGISG